MSLFSQNPKPLSERVPDPDSALRSYGTDGVSFASALKRDDWLRAPLSMGRDSELASLLSQLKSNFQLLCKFFISEELLLEEILLCIFPSQKQVADDLSSLAISHGLRLDMRLISYSDN